VFAADVDGDGNADVLAALRDEDTITWHENIGAALIDVCDGLGASGDPTAFVAPWSRHVGFDAVDIFATEDVSLIDACTTSTGSAPPSVTGLTQHGGGLHTVQLSGPIDVGEWTTIELTVLSDVTCLESVFCFQVGHLPGDCNGDGQVGLADATAFGAEYNGPQTLMLVDLNGDGQVNINDITLFGQIWNGTSGEGKNPDGTGGWNGQGLPERTVCTCP